LETSLTVTGGKGVELWASVCTFRRQRVREW